MSGRRKIESPEDLRSLDANSGQQTTERKSVFERLGTVGRRVGSSQRNNDFNETDLRFKVSRKRRKTDISPNRRSVSPQVRHQSSVKSSVKSEEKLDSNSKVKSLVLAPNRRSESPTNHSQSVSSSTSKRSTHSSHHLDDDIDSEELEQKRLQLQKELQELEKSGSIVHNNDKTLAINSTKPVLTEKVVVSDNRSRSSSVISSESGSYTSSLKSLAKTESSESSGNNANKEVVNSSVVKEESKESSTKTKSSEKSKTHVSSSITLKSVTTCEDTTRVKSSELKFDRHGNVRISLDEQERQKRLRAERFSQSKPQMTEPSVKKKRKKSIQDSNNSSEPKIVVSRDHSYTPPPKRSKDSTSESRRRDIPERSDDHKRSDYKSKSNSSRSKYESRTRSRSRERRDSRGSKPDDTHSKCSDKSSRTYLDTKSPNFRDRSRDSHYSDRDNTSITSKQSRKRIDNYSRDQSPAHSSHSKFSRDRESSIGSDFSRRSKSERLSTQSNDISVPNLNTNELKNSELKSNDTIIEEMSPISADSTIPDVPEMDSPNSVGKSKAKEEESLPKNKESGKSADESDDNFSDWSEGEDELLLKSDGFETLDEVCNISDNSMEKDSWNEKPIQGRRADSSNTRDDALEAISDDELDAIIGESDPIDSTVDSKKSNSNRQVLNALDIDWGSLVSEPKTKLEFIPGSARKRFSAANVLMRIGFSQTLAGQHMTQKLIDFCQNELKDEFVPFRHPMAAVHSLISERIKERRYLFGADTTQVLSGRRDLQIRKTLNKANGKLFDNYLTNSTIATTAPTTPLQPTPTPVSQSTITSSNSDYSVSTTITSNMGETNVPDIECY